MVACTLSKNPSNLFAGAQIVTVRCAQVLTNDLRNRVSHPSMSPISRRTSALSCTDYLREAASILSIGSGANLHIVSVQQAWQEDGHFFMQMVLMLSCQRATIPGIATF